MYVRRYVNVDHEVLVRSALTPYMHGFICLAVIENENTLYAHAYKNPLSM